MRELRARVLGVVNYEPISAYVKKGYSLEQLEMYYNPSDYFDSVHIFASGDTDWDISKKVHVHPLDSGFRAAIQLIKYCVRYDVCVLRNFEAFDLHSVTADVKYVLRVPAVISLHDILYPPGILEYDHILTYVEWMKEAIVAKYGCHDVTVLLNRIDENFFRPGTSHKVPIELREYSNRIVSIGRLDEKYKNQSTLIKAMTHVVEKHPDTLLVMIGEGSDRQRYEKLIDKLGLHHNVRMVGAQSQEMIGEYLNWCDFHALCNPFGDLGKSLVESLMVGKPVVATGGRGNSKYHLIDGFNAKTVHHQDIHRPECIAEAMCYLIESRDRFDSEAIRKRAVDEYGFEKLSQLEASVYEKVLRNHENIGFHTFLSEKYACKKEDNDTFNYRAIVKIFILHSYCLFERVVQRVCAFIPQGGSN